MRILIFSLLIICISFTSVNAQKTIFNQDFETTERGSDVTKLQTKKLNAWGKSKFTVTENKGKGNRNSNKFASSSDSENSTLVLYKNLEVGSTYVFTVAVKMTTHSDKASKATYNVKATSGNKGDIHTYGEDKTTTPKTNKWKEHKIEFTVIEGREKVAFQVYRWAEGVTLNVDNFNLIKE